MCKEGGAGTLDLTGGGNGKGSREEKGEKPGMIPRFLASATG